MLVKICGITRADDARAAVRCGADFIGFILADSPRRIAPPQVSEILAQLPHTPAQPVLVFRDEPLDRVIRALASTGVSWVQLHGRESVEYVQALHRSLPHVQVVRAWEVVPGGPTVPAGPTSGRSADEPLRDYLLELRRLEIAPAAVLLDVPKTAAHPPTAPPSEETPGEGLQRPDFDALAAVAREVRVLVRQVWCAGGLSPDHLPPALLAGDFDGVDVTRGVEAAPGVKDHEALARFIQLARAL